MDDFDADLYTTRTVEGEYRQLKTHRIEALSIAVLDHRRSVAEADLDATLGPTTIDHVRNRILDSDSIAARFLYRFYDDLGSFVDREALLEKLRDLARGVESVALGRKETLEAAVEE